VEVAADGADVVFVGVTCGCRVAAVEVTITSVPEVAGNVGMDVSVAAGGRGVTVAGGGGAAQAARNKTIRHSVDCFFIIFSLRKVKHF
jgi:hypothetical protein